MTPDDVRLTAQLVVDGRVHGISDASVEALARRVLELEGDAEEHADNVRRVEREACAAACDRVKTSPAASPAERNTAAALALAIRARGDAQVFTGVGDPVQWDPVPDDVVVAVCVEYRNQLVKALEAWFDGQSKVGWKDVVFDLKMLGRPIRARGAK